MKLPTNNETLLKIKIRNKDARNYIYTYYKILNVCAIIYFLFFSTSLFSLLNSIFFVFFI